MQTRNRVGILAAIGLILAILWHFVLPMIVALANSDLREKENERFVKNAIESTKRQVPKTRHEAELRRTCKLTLTPDGTLTRSGKPPDVDELARFLRKQNGAYRKAVDRAAQLAPLDDKAHAPSEWPELREAFKKRLGPFVVAVAFQDASKNTWPQLRTILEAAAKAQTNDLRLDDVPVTLPDVGKPEPLPPDGVVSVAPAFLPLAIATDADLARLRNLAPQLTGFEVLVDSDTRTPVSHLLAVLRILTAAKSTFYFGVGPATPNDKTGVTLRRFVSAVIEELDPPAPPRDPAIEFVEPAPDDG